MYKETKYDDSDADSILSFAKKLVNKSLRNYLPTDIHADSINKGSFGQLIERYYFEYEVNSISEPDFPKAGVELKSTPLKKTKTKGLRSKERLVLNIIDYHTEHLKTFVTSSFWRKNKLLLIIFYVYDPEIELTDYKVKAVELWRFPPEDLKIIKDDWVKIVTKIKAGQAHEISEGDTFYLGACTKGATKSSHRTQPFSNETAMQRAFALKSKYINYIYDLSRSGEVKQYSHDEYEEILDTIDILNDPATNYYKKGFSDSIVKSIDDYQDGESFENLVKRRFQPFLGMSYMQILNNLGLKDTNAKSKYYLLAKAILGVDSKQIAEFEKADVIMKTVIIRPSGMPRESMSFSQIQYKEIVLEDWEESYWYETLTKRFFIVVFMDKPDGSRCLHKVFFWTMPNHDLEIAKEFWLDTKNKILSSQFENFIRIADERICHVRPKGKNSKDLMETALGTMEKKKCYWLNAAYIKQVVANG